MAENLYESDLTGEEVDRGTCLYDADELLFDSNAGGYEFRVKHTSPVQVVTLLNSDFNIFALEDVDSKPGHGKLQNILVYIDNQSGGDATLYTVGNTNLATVPVLNNLDPSIKTFILDDTKQAILFYVSDGERLYLTNFINNNNQDLMPPTP